MNRRSRLIATVAVGAFCWAAAVAVVEANQSTARGAGRTAALMHPSLMQPSGVAFREVPSSVFTVVGSGDGRVTFGVLVCAAPGAELHLIEVIPDASVGSEVSLVGVQVRRLPRGGEVVWASSGYPPAGVAGGHETISALDDGSAVEPCGSPWLTEIQVGLARIGPSGGGWNGVRISYTGDDSGQVVAPVGMLFCGPATTPC